MKKLLSILLATTMVIGLAATALADETFDSETDGDPTYTCNTIEVSAVADEATIDVRYNVTVSWKSLTFKYDRTNQSWNPSNHSYSGTGSWESDSITDGITVANHSNAEVAISASAPSAKNGVTVAVTGGDKTLVSAATDGIYGVYDNADKTTYKVAVSGAPTVDEQFTVGTVTITIAAV